MKSDGFYTNVQYANARNDGSKNGKSWWRYYASCSGCTRRYATRLYETAFYTYGWKERADDVPAMLSRNEFVMTADAVRAAGDGDVNKGAQRMYDLMNNLEAKA